MRRILIIGISGTGKTRFAEAMGEALELPVIHLDTIFWTEGWHEEEPRVVQDAIANVIAEDAWIIEGYIQPLASERLERADLVVYLDHPGRNAFIGGLQRWWQFRGRTRPELPAGCIERLGWRFLMTLLLRHERPEIEEAVNGYESKTVRLRSRRQQRTFLAQICQ